MPDAGPPFTQPFRKRLLERALHYVARAKEDGGNNLGPLVEHFQRCTGGVPGEPWCADFLVCCALEAMGWPKTMPDIEKARGYVGQAFMVTSGVAMLAADAKHRGTWRRATYKHANAGWPVCFTWADGKRHVGIVVSDEGDYLTTVEGNTGGPEGQDDGVWRKVRSKKYVWGYIDIGD